ncbi:ParB/RepB/Spo0J family partition protein [Azospirillum sp. RWY-5-1]|uniref:ParB/RepB/Spo0J family partition protein n=1 Tax=Azospirillum oleiclasticum TaxID=2735135 RepID=A0ABX2T697_9PROT|nr:ParB/RepB/Spo0J family partition protein [Azospirillum oleiclasticum]NYZ12536.1 ParB/RepB/Spo0J family partition protein [Azospirillum oleiclasticum]NYZ19696.1 ParB/RepB/Spo0J family partition protein [Azospirillum oleiclasticum]
MARNRPQGNTSMIARASSRAAEQVLAGEGGRKLREVPVDQIVPNPHQPRRHFDEGGLERLGQSIAAKGLIQPISVWQVGLDRYQLIAGERRWRASRMAGLPTVTAIVRSERPDEATEALIENLVREDLDVLEEAHAIERLLEEQGVQQDELAAMLGKDPAEITRSRKILRLPKAVLEEYRDHRAMVSRAQMVAIAEAADVGTQMQLWGMAKSGVSSTAIRAARKGGAGEGGAVPVPALTRSLRSLGKLVDGLPSEPVPLGEEERRLLEAARARIDSLLGG